MAIIICYVTYTLTTAAFRINLCLRAYTCIAFTLNGVYNFNDGFYIYFTIAYVLAKRVGNSQTQYYKRMYPRILTEKKIIIQNIHCGLRDTAAEMSVYILYNKNFLGRNLGIHSSIVLPICSR